MKMLKIIFNIRLAASDFISDLFSTSPIKGFAILTLLSIRNTSCAPLPISVIDVDFDQGFARATIIRIIISEIRNRHSIVIFLEILSCSKIFMLLIVVLSDIETIKGKADKGNNINQSGSIKLIYKLLSIILSSFERLRIISNRLCE